MEVTSKGTLIVTGGCGDGTISIDLFYVNNNKPFDVLHAGQLTIVS